MKKIQLLMIAVLMAAAFSACSNNGSDNKDLGPEKRVTIKLATTPISKADKDPVSPGTITTVNDVVVFFLDGNDRISNPIETMTGSEITDGKTFIGVNPATTKVYLVANTNYEGSPLFTELATFGLATHKSEIENLSAMVSKQMDMTNPMGIGNVLLSGEAPLVAVDAVNYTVKVPVTPAVCRFEVTSLTGYNDVAEYTLEGIYLNGYYKKFTIGGGHDGEFVGISTNETELNSVDAYMKDSGLNLTGSLTYQNPTAGKVWAYVVPVYTTSPRIILRLDNVKVVKTPSPEEMNPSTQYITVKNFKDAMTGETVVLKRGEVYSVKDIKFQINDLTPEPNQDKINVEVEVEVKGWKVYSVDPEI